MSNKLNELYKSLNHHDIIKLGEFVRSPFLNKSKIMVSVYSYLKKQKRKGTDKVDIKELYSFVYPQKGFDNNKARLLTSDFAKIIEEYLKLSMGSENEYCMDYVLLNNLRKKNADKSYSMLLKKIYKEFENKVALDVDEYCFLGKVESSKVMFNMLNIKLTNRKINYDKSMSCYQMLFILSTIRKSNLHLLSQIQWNEKKEDEQFFLKQAMNYVSLNLRDIKKFHGMIYIEYLINKMFNDCVNYTIHDKLFKALKSMYRKLYYEQLGHIFFSYNAQFMMAANSSSNTMLHSEKMFNVIKFYYQIGFFETYNVTAEMFFNIVNVSSMIDPNFSRKFISKYEIILKNSPKKDFVYLSKAVVFIIEKKYDEAITELNKIEMINYQIYLISKTYLARIYYLTDQYDSLLYLIDASRHFLFRHKTSLGQRYYKFKKYFDYLLKITNVKEKDPDMVAIYKTEINAQDSFVGKVWLLEEIDKLLKK